MVLFVNREAERAYRAFYAETSILEGDQVIIVRSGQVASLFIEASPLS